MQLTSIVNLLTNLIRTLASTGMLLTVHHASAYQWAFVSMIVSAVAASIGVGIVTVRFGWPKFAPSLFLKHGMEGLGYSFAWSSASVYNDIDKTMLSHYGMNVANGVYSMAYRVVDIASIPNNSIGQAALPRLFQSGRSGLAAATELSNRLMKRTLLIGVFAAVVICVTAPLLPRIAGPGFSESAVAIRWLCLIPVFRSIHVMTGITLLSAGLQRYRTVAQLIAAGMNVFVNFWLIPRYGWLGAAWSSLATDGALVLMYWMLMRVLMPRGELRVPLRSIPGATDSEAS